MAVFRVGRVSWYLPDSYGQFMFLGRLLHDIIKIAVRRDTQRHILHPRSRILWQYNTKLGNPSSILQCMLYSACVLVIVQPDHHVSYNPPWQCWLVSIVCDAFPQGGGEPRHTKTLFFFFFTQGLISTRLLGTVAGGRVLSLFTSPASSAPEHGRRWP